MKLHIHGFLEVNDELYTDPEAQRWLVDLLLGDLFILHSNEIGDEVGSLEITEIIED